MVGNQAPVDPEATASHIHQVATRLLIMLVLRRMTWLWGQYSMPSRYSVWLPSANVKASPNTITGGVLVGGGRLSTYH